MVSCVCMSDIQLGFSPFTPLYATQLANLCSAGQVPKIAVISHKGVDIKPTLVAANLIK